MPRITNADWDSWLLERCMVPDGMDERAQELLDVYVEIRRSYYPQFRPSKALQALKPQWWRVAKKVIEEDMIPYEWVSLCFSKQGADTLISHLTDRNSRRIYAELTKQERKQVEVLLVLAIKNLQVRLAETQHTVETALQDKWAAFNSLFIYCVATQRGCLEVAARHQLMATRLLKRKAYRDTYKAAFPEVLKDVR